MSHPQQKVYYARYYAKNRDAILKKTAEYKAANKDAVRERNRAYRRANLGVFVQHSRRWQQRNPAVVTALVARRKARLLRATPAWANTFFIEEAYDLAQRRTQATGFEWHVDHVIPLQGKTVCGLHVESNLRVVPAAVNHSKGNRHWPDMP
jgi:hypothetical protein